jgi:hypothetical protein
MLCTDAFTTSFSNVFTLMGRQLRQPITCKRLPDVRYCRDHPLKTYVHLMHHFFLQTQSDRPCHVQWSTEFQWQQLNETTCTVYATFKIRTLRLCTHRLLTCTHLLNAHRG